MMAENYVQNADGSSNPTGEAQPQDYPLVTTNVAAGFEAKVVEAPAPEKPKGQRTATTKAKSTRKRS